MSFPLCSPPHINMTCVKPQECGYHLVIMFVDQYSAVVICQTDSSALFEQLKCQTHFSGWTWGDSVLALIRPAHGGEDEKVGCKEEADVLWRTQLCPIRLKALLWVRSLQLKAPLCECAALGKFTVRYSMCQGALSLWQLHVKIPFSLSYFGL